MRTESTDAVRGLLLEFCCAASAAPKPPLLMSAAVHETPQRSSELPYATNVSLVGHEVELDRALSVVPIVPPFTRRAAASMIVPPLPFLNSHSTRMPWIVLPDGMEKPNPVHLRKFEMSPWFTKAAVASTLLLVWALAADVHATVPIPVAFTHVPAALTTCVRHAPRGFPAACWQRLL